MGSTINTNIASLNAQRNLTTSQSALATSLQRLSSGLRINSAKDDAAGLAISDRFSTQIRGLNQAVRNANDGISLAQTGESALAEVSNNLQRVRELAVQATNSTNSTADRAAINLEVQQRLAEIDRTASQTSFNGTKLLDGSFGTANFQVGANAGETISVALSTNVRVSGAGQIASTTSAVLGATATGGSIAATNSTLAFGTDAQAATAGKATLNVTTALFGTAGQSFTGGSTNVKTVATTNFSAAGQVATLGSVAFTATDKNFAAAVPGSSAAVTFVGAPLTTNFSTAGQTLVAGTNVQTVTGFDFSGVGLAQFDVAGQSVTLTTNTTNESGLASAIQSQLTGITVAGVDASGEITFTRTGSSVAVPITSSDVNAVTAGIADSVGTTGTPFIATTNATFAINGGDGAQTITLAAASAGGNMATFISNVNAAIQNSNLTDKANYIAVADGSTGFHINHTGDVDAVNITAADANANAIGIVTSSGTAGSTTNDPVSFTVDAGGLNRAVTLSANYATFDDMRDAIDSQLADGEFTVTNTNGAFTITRAGAAGAGSTAIAITGDAAALGAGIDDNAAGYLSTAGLAQADRKQSTFTVGATAVTLNADYGTTQGVEDAIQAQLGGAYNVTRSGNDYTFTSTSSSAAVAVSVAADPNGVAASALGFTATAGVGGQAAVATTNASLTVDGYTFSLTTDYANLDALATDINDKLETANPGGNVLDVGTGLTGQYTVTNNNGALTIKRNTTGNGSTAIAFAVNSGPAAAFNTIVSTGGQDEVVSTNASFKVDGHTVTLNQNYGNQQALVDALDGQLAGYTVSTTGGSNITFTNDTTGSAAVAIAANTGATAAAQAKAISSGFSAASGTAGVAGGSITLANFAINGTSLAASYASTSALATAINSNVSNVYATVVGGALNLASSSAIAMTGAEATGSLGFGSASVAANSGSLSTANTLTVADANTTIQRIDSALGSVSTLRSTFGAVQNRFESVISSLSATSENLTAARSRIQDADFAAETAGLTRNQILQQAGIAMLAQANALPQSVLSLLK